MAISDRALGRAALSADEAHRICTTRGESRKDHLVWPMTTERDVAVGR